MICIQCGLTRLMILQNGWHKRQIWQSWGNNIGIDIDLEERESSVGSFNVDIYAVESGTGRKIIIENQLEDTNHDHLGKLITYASGPGAKTAENAPGPPQKEGTRSVFR